MELVFHSDTAQRKGWFTGVSFSHPAKMALPLQLWIIENYTKPGDIILDPMAGSGTVLVACSMGRDVICVELESKFIDIIKGNWAKVQQRGPQMGYTMGKAMILQGDARQLPQVLCDAIITSPPYTNRMDVVISSPPYAESDTAFHDANSGEWYDKKRGKALPKAGDNPSNIGNLPYGSIDAILTSPPYEGSISDPRDVITSIDASKSPDWRPGPNSQVNQPQHYGHNGNIGNLKAESYLADYWDILDIIAQIPYNIMREVYGQCLLSKKSNATGITDTTKKSRRKSGLKWQLGESNEGILALIADNLATLGLKDAELVLGRLEEVVISQMKQSSNSVLSSKNNMQQVNALDPIGIGAKPSHKSQGTNRHSGKVDVSIGKAQASLPSEQDSTTWLGGIANSVEQPMETSETRFKFIMSYLSRKVAQIKNPNVLFSVIAAIVQSKTNSAQGVSLDTNNLEESSELRELWIRSSPEQNNNYLAQMFLVYRGCYRMLKDSGLLILVVKNFIRNKAEVDLRADTVKLAEQAGFTFIEEHYRKLTQQSFWRILYQRKYPDGPVIDKEYVLVLRKEA